MSDNFPIVRSVLYVPGADPQKIEKALTSQADGVILDLEDSTAPNSKVAARGHIVEAVRRGNFGHRTVIVRCNALSTEWGPEDLRQVAAVGPHAILAPKVNSERDVRAYLGAMKAAPPHTELWVMTETVACFNGNLPGIAAIGSEPSSRLTALVMGTNDIKKEMRALDAPGREPLRFALAQAVIAARVNNLLVIDGVYNKFIGKDKSEDENKAIAAEFEAECRQGHYFGFDGKTLIHPSHVGVANRIFRPGAAEVIRDQKIIDIFDMPENIGKAVVTAPWGGMLEAAIHLVQAKRTVEIDHRIQEIEDIFARDINR
jgi:citrate lyase subunit beta / citryl-CoA lyase